ncbi:hypothetical protein EYF80_061598 [Liparis tanakae]|uniref:Uncharacterized protein n=1 Tax=Liparis tanakae TaxID=230148 RepID=A0A4Z2EIG8_9TELE|nr:hypothetical protein EYF80_061598 [Liparis tanakae]
MHVLLSTYKAEQKKGNQGAKRREKKQVELGILKLFEDDKTDCSSIGNVSQDSLSSGPSVQSEGTPSDQQELPGRGQGGCDPKDKWSRAEEEEDSHKEDTQMTLSEVRKLQIRKRELLQSNEVSPTGSMFPVIIREQGFKYRPLQSTDMLIIIEKLPIIQDGAHPWISKLDQLLIGQLPAVGDVKKILANIVGVGVLGENLQKAGLNQYVGTSVNDSDLFAAIRGKMCRALKITFPTNVHPDNIIIRAVNRLKKIN